MSYLTVDTIRKMKSVGFRFPEYEHEYNMGRTYYYDGCEYTIGDNWTEDCSLDMKRIAEIGEWLPDEGQLTEWLQRNMFDFTIKWSDKDQYFHCDATDMLTKTNYSAGGGDLLNCLAKVIYKICKSAQRDLIPSSNLSLDIISEERYE